MTKDPLEIAQLIVRGEYINFGKSTFNETSALYRFTNEDITSYFNHLKNKESILTVIGSGCQVINSILAGSKNIDCFDISVFPEYFLHLKLASILALKKEEFLKYYFSDDREEIFSDEFYDKISPFLKGKYKEFWDTLYMFDDGYDIYNSLLFRSDISQMKTAIEYNPYLQNNNYERLKEKLKYEAIKINSKRYDITKIKLPNKYDLINLSNILTYYYKPETLSELIEFLKRNFNLTDNGEIISYFFGLEEETEKNMNELLNNNSNIETTKEALKHIKEKDPMNYKVVIRNIKKIEEHRENWHSYFCNEKGIPIARINKNTYTCSIQWYASVLVHEAYHSKLYNDALLDGIDPMKVCSGYSAEMYCLTKQIECMKLIEACKEDIDWAISCYDKRWWENYQKQIYIAPVRKKKIKNNI